MINMKPHNTIRFWLAALLIVTCCAWANNDKSTWQQKQVDWRMNNGSKIKGVKHPKDKPLPMFRQRKARKSSSTKTEKTLTTAKPQTAAASTVAAVPVNIITSPPIDGFIPWIAVATNNVRGEELDLIAVPTTNYAASFPTGYDPQTDYVIGIHDTGASAMVMGYDAATQSRLFSGNLVTNNSIDISGVTGSVSAWVSQPLGVFIDGLDAIDPSGNFNTSNVVGQTNTSIIVGKNNAHLPDLPVAIGTPLSVYYTSVFNNQQPITVTHDSNDFTGPDIDFYQHGDNAIPSYPQIVPLELRPLGGTSVQYIPNFDIFDVVDIFEPITFEPGTPSIIIGNLSQSVFFVHSVDLKHRTNTAIDKTRFMLDTGAQVTVIGSRVGARLALNKYAPDFTVEIEGVTGDISDEPGFYIDSIKIPALGGWLNFTNVPVILLDIASPEGGTLDGIIGMNLFVDFNFVLKGGGLFLQDDPSLELQYFGSSLVVDIAPDEGDGKVDHLDLLALVNAYLATPISPQWKKKYDMVSDGIINLLDFAVLADHWLEETQP